MGLVKWVGLRKVLALQGFEYNARTCVKNLGTVVCACNSNLREVETGGLLGLIGQLAKSNQQAPEQGEIQSLKLRWTDPEVVFWPYTQTHPGVPIHI